MCSYNCLERTKQEDNSMAKLLAICYLHLEELDHNIKLPFKSSTAKRGTISNMGDIF